MQFQVRYEYNTTGKLSNRTDTLTYRVTSSWDRLQTQVGQTHQDLSYIISYITCGVYGAPITEIQTMGALQRS